MKATINRLFAALMIPASIGLMPLCAIAHVQAKESIKTRSSLTSIYTDFARQCRTLQKPTDRNLTLLRACPGVAGYRFVLEWDDDVLTITMVTPKGKKIDRGLGETFINSKPYADLKGKAEWRIVRDHGTVVPVGLIVRVEPMDDRSTSERSFLAVARSRTRKSVLPTKFLRAPTKTPQRDKPPIWLPANPVSRLPTNGTL